jgi:hypothetical protein
MTTSRKRGSVICMRSAALSDFALLAQTFFIFLRGNAYTRKKL